MSSFISSPTELLKIRMQLQKPLPGTPGYHGPLGMLQQVVRQDGILGEHSTARQGLSSCCQTS